MSRSRVLAKIIIYWAYRTVNRGVDVVFINGESRVSSTELLGDQAVDQPLTIVLPMHNCERQVRSSVQDILDLAPVVPSSMELVIVDDGSTDDTYEAACEMARKFPQVTVLRQSLRLGMGAALDLVRNRLAVEMILVHDGISPINVVQLQAMLQSDRTEMTTFERAASPIASTVESSGSRRFAAVRELHNRMEEVHRSVTTFRWIQLEKPLVPRRCKTESPMSAETMPRTTPVVPLASLTTTVSTLPQN